MEKSANSISTVEFQAPHLRFTPKSFDDIEQILASLFEGETKKLSPRRRFKQINECLLNLITTAPTPAFLLPHVIDFIKRINLLELFDELYHITQFEYWLNQFSNLSDEENYLVRAKIMGKYIPREDYQAYFPVGMNYTHLGSHFVSSHLSPDVDTMIASFWGWADAFAARVSSGQHFWS